MKQAVLPFQHAEEKSSTGMTALSGQMTYLDLMHTAFPSHAPSFGKIDALQVLRTARTVGR